MSNDSSLPTCVTYTYDKYVPLTAMADATGGTEQTGDPPDPILLDSGTPYLTPVDNWVWCPRNPGTRNPVDNWVWCPRNPGTR